MVLNTYKPEHIPILTNANGRVDRNFFFLYGENTEVFQSCGLTWRNQFYLFGGANEKRQVAKLSSCKLERVGQLDFDLDKGGCANLNDEKIYLCFGLEQNTKKCRYATDPLESFALIEETSHSHSNTRIAASKSKCITQNTGIIIVLSKADILAVGGGGSEPNKEAELLLTERNRWISLQEYPYVKGINYRAVTLY